VLYISDDMLLLLLLLLLPSKHFSPW